MSTGDDAHHSLGSGKWRIPVGSLIVDGAMVLMLVYTAGRMTNSLENIDRRVGIIEQRDITPEAARRISVLEEQTRHADAETDQLLTQLTRIEQKIDQHMVRQAK